MGRFSLAGILWFVAFVALGFAAVRTASGFWVGATFVMMFGLLCASVLGTILERGQDRAWWLGFALFGWPYFVASLFPAVAEVTGLPSRDLARRAFAASNPPPTIPGMVGPDGLPISPSKEGVEPAGLTLGEYEQRYRINAPLAGHWLFIVIFARAGAAISSIFTNGLPWRRRTEVAPAPDPSPVP